MKGKTIKDYLDGIDSRVICFTDETFARIYPAYGYEGEPIVEIDEDYQASDTEKHYFGLISDDEWRELLAEKDAKRKDALKRQELQLLKELMEKYGVKE